MWSENNSATSTLDTALKPRASVIYGREWVCVMHRTASIQTFDAIPRSTIYTNIEIPTNHDRWADWNEEFNEIQEVAKEQLWTGATRVVDGSNNHNNHRTGRVPMCYKVNVYERLGAFSLLQINCSQPKINVYTALCL